MLQLADGQRIQQVIFAVDAIVITAANRAVPYPNPSAAGTQTHASSALRAPARRGQRPPGAKWSQQNTRSTNLLIQADRLEHLRPAIALQGGDPHLRECLQQTFVDGLDEVLAPRLRRSNLLADSRARPCPPRFRAPGRDSPRWRRSRSAARKCITSRGSPDSMISATWVRVSSRTSRLCTAASASRLGMGA